MDISDKSFAQAFCEIYGIPVESFEDTVLPKVLYPHARFILIPLNKWFGVSCLKADHEILADAGHTRDVEGIAAVLSRLPWYYGSQWNMRREFRLRISSRRVLAIASKVGVAKARRRPARGEAKGARPIPDGTVPAA